MRYLIKKGKHNRLSIPSIHFGIKRLKFRFKFDSSCLYSINDTDDYDLNKLYGWSMGMHHNDSLRIGWRPDEREANRIQIHTYMYNKKKRNMNFISRVDVDKWYEMDIEILLCNKVAFTLSDETGRYIAKVVEENFVIPKFTSGYFLDFFMGGDKPARQDTIAWIERIKI